MNPSITFAVIQATGTDAESFLQGQLTQNMAFADQQWRYAAHCNPKGRVINFFLMLRHGDSYYLITPRHLADTAISQLKKYVLRSKVTLQIIDLQADQDTIAAQLLAHLGIDSDEQPPAVRDLQRGIFCLHEATVAEFTPEALNLDLLGAVDFAKGCYTGQEVVARMHYLGKAKKRLFCAEIHTETALSPNNSVINAEGKSVGRVVDCQWQSEPNRWTVLTVLNSDSVGAADTLKASDAQLQNVTAVTG